MSNSLHVSEFIFIQILSLSVLSSCTSIQPNRMVECETAINNINDLTVNDSLANYEAFVRDLPVDGGDGYSEIVLSISQGPFPIEVSEFPGAERRSKVLDRQYDSIPATLESIEFIYRRIIVIENSFRNKKRKLNRLDMNDDLICLARSPLSYCLQYLFVRRYAREIRSINDIPYGERSYDPDLIGRKKMIKDFVYLCNKYGYTLTAMLWTGEKSFGNESPSEHRTEALKYFLEN